MPLRLVTPRESTVALVQYWREHGKTFDLEKVLSSDDLWDDDGVNGRLNEIAKRELPARLGTVGTTTLNEESTRALLRGLPDYLLEIKRGTDIDPPYDVDQVQSFDNFYRDVTRAFLRAVVLQLLFSTGNPPHLVALALEREFADPANINRCWYEITGEFVDHLQEDLGIVYKFG